MAQALSGAALALSVILLTTVRVRGMSIALAVQGWMVACAILSRGFAEGAVLAAIALAAGGVAFPVAMERIAGDRDRETEVGATGWTVLAGAFALVALAVSLASLIALPEDLALALSVVLLGLLRIVARGGLIARIAGALVIWHGTVLVAGDVGGVPIVAVMLLAWLAVPGFGLWVLAHGPADAAD
ncbi:MAG: hypothetical protein FWD12_02695 [Alphaproteobacteria bacterium]|nr:hypothetical protein [Alphaproteobacteria bacterium]